MNPKQGKRKNQNRKKEKETRKTRLKKKEKPETEFRKIGPKKKNGNRKKPKPEKRKQEEKNEIGNKKEKSSELEKMDVRKELEKVASQQRVPLTEEETEKFGLQLGQVLEAFKKLDSADTSGIEPSYHPLEIPSQFREDEPEAPTAPTQNAQRIEKKYVRGPRMMRHQ